MGKWKKWGWIAGPIGYAVTSMVSSAQESKEAAEDILDRQMGLIEGQVEQSLSEREAARIALDKQREDYRGFEFKNPYENLTNTFAGMQNAYEGMENVYEGATNVFDSAVNVYEGMENVYEDLQVSTVAADFQMQQGAQQRANILSGLSGAAGSSGIAGLAQSLAQQGTLQARQVSVDLAQQQQANERLRAQGAGQVQMAQLGEDARLQQMRLGEDARLQQMRLGERGRLQQLTRAEQARLDLLGRQGAMQVQQQRLAGEQYVQDLEFGRESTLLGMAYGQATGAEGGYQTALANQMTGMMAQAGMHQQNLAQIYGLAGNFMNMAGNVAGAATGSDRRLKKNITKIGESPSGINIYSFEYKNSTNGEGVFQGVMSDEVDSSAVLKGADGYDMVDYSMIDVEFKKLK